LSVNVTGPGLKKLRKKATADRPPNASGIGRPPPVICTQVPGASVRKQPSGARNEQMVERKVLRGSYPSHFNGGFEKGNPPYHSPGGSDSVRGMDPGLPPVKNLCAGKEGKTDPGALGYWMPGRDNEVKARVCPTTPARKPVGRVKDEKPGLWIR